MRSARRLLLLALLAYATGLSGVLAWKNRELRVRNAELIREARLPQPGMYVPAVVATALDGQPLPLGDPVSGSRQLLLVFNTRCEFCLASLPAWRTLSRALAGSPEVQVVGVSLDPPDETATYIAQHDFEIPTVSVEDRRVKATYRWTAVPLVMMVEPEGLVSYSRLGELAQRVAVDSVLMIARHPSGSFGDP